ncbi:MAG: DNA repair protein RadC [Flavobacteriales bacterium]|nr:DNA repair protein RadC [Flavobacteriales bacterium]MDW8409380.1 DNA repair protein RadC [Flavobacteriales bacterium]
MGESRTPIKLWAKDERPREKFIMKGPQALSDAELLAILLNTGTAEKSALDVARDLLKKYHNSIAELSRLTVDDLSQIKGVGPKKAVTLLAALELGRRRQRDSLPSKLRISSSQLAYEALRSYLEDHDREHFLVALTNNQNQIKHVEYVAMGGLTQVVVDPKVVFRLALMHKATGILVAHNHPSGQLQASEQDILLTKKLVAGAKSLEIRFLDHLIITANGYLSFREENLIED